MELFDCINCDKCVPVCPNDANFAYRFDAEEIPIRFLGRDEDGFRFDRRGEFEFASDHQLANFADFCNECGNCDVFCPEDGGPYVLKPRVFGRLEDWRRFAEHDGLCYVVRGDTRALHARVAGVEYTWTTTPDDARYEGPGFDLCYDPTDPLRTLAGRLDGECDWTWTDVLRRWRDALFDDDAVHWPAFTADL